MYLPFATDGSEGSDLLLSFEYSWFKGRDFEGREEEFEGSMDSLCNINFFKRCSSSMRCLKFMKVKKKEGKGFSIFGISLSFHLFMFDIKKTYGSTIWDKFTYEFSRKIVLSSFYILSIVRSTLELLQDEESSFEFFEIIKKYHSQTSSNNNSLSYREDETMENRRVSGQRIASRAFSNGEHAAISKVIVARFSYRHRSAMTFIATE